MTNGSRELREVALPKDGAKGRGKEAPQDAGGLKGLMDERVAHPWLLLSLAGVGGVAVGGTLVTLFSALGDRPAETWATDAPEVGWAPPTWTSARGS